MRRMMGEGKNPQLGLYKVDRWIISKAILDVYVER